MMRLTLEESDYEGTGGEGSDVRGKELRWRSTMVVIGGAGGKPFVGEAKAGELSTDPTLRPSIRIGRPVLPARRWRGTGSIVLILWRRVRSLHLLASRRSSARPIIVFAILR